MAPPIKYPGDSLAAKLVNLNFHQLEVDPQPQVGDNFYSTILINTLQPFAWYAKRIVKAWYRVAPEYYNNVPEPAGTYILSAKR